MTALDPPDTAVLLISAIDREEIRARLLADREAYTASAELDPGGRAALAQVERALRRLDTPAYGYCAQCGERVATARLLTVPYTEFCLVCWGTRRRDRAVARQA